ncbi:MAG: MBL fold metallo-hydrolase [Planctomycetota bacterium]|nr:MBL fold metallo-hydrolase [Planctomycetota bacterium]
MTQRASVPDVRVISIGALASNPLWNERGAVRTGHATTTLIRAGGASILVDPGLPEQAIAARLRERTGRGPESITHVFLTSFAPETTRGLDVFEDAEWLIHGPEREGLGAFLATRLRDLIKSGIDSEEDRTLKERLEADVARLRKCKAAEDTIAPGVDLFPLPGVTPGLCGLLVEHPGRTILITGDAVATQEHLEQGKVLPGAADVKLAQESFAEAVEIADVMVLGRDNLVLNPARRPF